MEGYYFPDMFQTNIQKLTKENSNFRKVVYTGKHSQLVLMSLKVGEEIGLETHGEVDQSLFFVEGNAEGILNGESKTVGEGDVVFVPAGTEHNFKNVGEKELKLYTIYSPPEHPDGTIHASRADALKSKD
jgi:mannose-6-phosphate isomerase-like protein (cupin superfamily)